MSAVQVGARESAREKIIILGEDEPEVRGYLEMALRFQGYTVESAENGEEVLECLQRNRNVAAVLLDVLMPKKDGMETLRSIRQIDPRIPVIILSGLCSPVNIVEAMRNGATDFLGKPVTNEDLAAAIEMASRTQQKHSPPVSETNVGNVFFGSDPVMNTIRTSLPRIAAADVPILILGETGTGKEVLARHIHAQSARAKKPFLKVNCAAVPSELVESELFGYERGAFTGAFQRKTGIFEAADGGTILLDEIGDMDFKLQAKLLQVLQDSQFTRVGGKDTVTVDVRVIAATHVNLERAIVDRRFRQDLYFRLNVVALKLPPLRERLEDIGTLSEFLLRKYAGTGRSPQLTDEMREAFESYKWPGNIRELENILKRYMIFQDPREIIQGLREGGAEMPAAEPPAAAAPSAGLAFAAATAAGPTAVASPEPETVPAAEASTAPASARPAIVPDGGVLQRVSKAKEEAEIEVILNALRACRWNRKQAANDLQIDYKALLYKMKKLNIA